MTAFLPIVRSATLDGFDKLCSAHGLDGPALLRQAGLDPRSLRDPQTPLAAEAVHALLENSSRLSGLSDFGLRLAAQRTFASLGPVSLLIKGQASVGEGLRTLLDYLRLLNPSLRVSLVPRGQWVVLQEELLGSGTQPTAQSMELALGIMQTILRELLGTHWRPVSVHFEHAAPDSWRAHERYFACPIRFRDGFNGIALKPADLLARPVGGDPGLAGLASQVLDLAMEDAQGPSAMVRQLVMALLPGGGCTSALVARHLGVDRRTLHRYLSGHGQNFSGLVHGLRREWVIQHLQLRHLKLAEIASLLGFSSQSAFAYWFRSQFGCSVSQWRRHGDVSSGLARASAGGMNQTGPQTSA